MLYLQLIFWILIFLIVYVYFLYPLTLFIFSRFRSKEIVEDFKYEPKVSLLIAAYNEEDVIEKKY
ncbi:hypothetical protein [Bacillus coahuilensis]|uniref:hypothetical protein n=1 Tax=Bacillus coahuilensis TaxID=408580 RepID=UPI000750351E|nr:hypothetical protein [Bacillus coahuilensis]